MARTLFILQNHLGGITSLCANLIRHRPADAPGQAAILLTDTSDPSPTAREPLDADDERIFRYSQRENVYRVIDRLALAIGDEPGPLSPMRGSSLCSSAASARIARSSRSCMTRTTCGSHGVTNLSLT